VAELVLERRGLIAVVIVVAFFAVVAIGSGGEQVAEDEQQDLTAIVQGAMVQAGLPTVEVRVVDWTVVLEGRVASSELKEAATRVAQAQPAVISVDNRLSVPAPIVVAEEPETPDLPAEQADLLLQARLSAAGTSPPIRFQSGGDRITVESVPTLDLLAGFLATNPTVSIQIIGHTDSDGEAAANLELSATRAEAVRTQLVARGIESERLATLGLGETDPIADNLTKGGKNANRRIEFLLIPVGGEGLAPPTTTTFAPVAEEPAPTTVPAG
jgi:outer membrane protein OmpA-like peptidoglycan-associated protein